MRNRLSTIILMVIFTLFIIVSLNITNNRAVQKRLNRDIKEKIDRECAHKLNIDEFIIIDDEK